MDKQKQIEEMAHNLCLNERYCEDCERNGVCLAYSTATIIYNAGYRKILEGAVVLTKEEYDELLIAKDFDYGYHDGECNMTSYYENIILPQSRKETAKELATRIKAKVDEISSCGLVEEYVTLFNKHIDDIVNGYVKVVENG